MSCRDARSSDLQALAQVHIAAWRAAYGGLMDPEFLKTLGPEHALVRLRPAMEPQPPLVVVVEHNQNIVGFCRFGLSRETDTSPHTGEVFACNIHPDHWRRGFGAEVMAAAISRLAALNCSTCKLWVLEQNDRARRFYSAVGFSPDGATRVEAVNTEYPQPEVRYSRAI